MGGTINLLFKSLGHRIKQCWKEKVTLEEVSNLQFDGVDGWLLMQASGRYPQEQGLGACWPIQDKSESWGKVGDWSPSWKLYGLSFSPSSHIFSNENLLCC